MKARVCPVLLALLGALSLCAVARAQTEVNPQFYMWLPESDAPGAPAHDPQFEPMVRVNIEFLEGGPAADAVIAEIRNRQNAGTLDDHKLCVELFGYGIDDPDNMMPSSFFDEDDSITITGTWPDPGDTFSHHAYRNPWSNVAAARLSNWMHDFCARYAEVQGTTNEYLPSPDRFYFDMESAITGCCSPNYVFLLAKMSQDPKWSTEDLRGYPSGKTMARLYNDARTANPSWNWPEHIADGLDTSQQAGYLANRQYMLWYYAIANRVRDAIMDETAYSQIHSYWPDCKVCNYDDVNTDGQVDKTGWFSDSAAAQNPVNQFGRVDIDPGDPGAILSVENTGRWCTYTQATVADLSSPHFYLSNESHEQPDWYLPNAPQEDQWTASMRDHRLWAESIINSGVGQHEGTLAPWLPMTCDTVPMGGGELSVEQLIPLMLMLRAKNITESGFWAGTVENPNGDLANNWQTTEDVVHRAYSAHITSASATRGTQLTPVEETDRLMFTLRDSGGNDRTCDIESYGGITELLVKFQVGYGADDATTFLVNVECSVDDSTARGIVLVYNFVHDRWDPVPTRADEGYATYGFYTPDLSSRRTFLTLTHPTNEIIGPGNEAILKFIHKSAQRTTVFHSRYDLIQILPRYLVNPIVCCEIKQADYNYDGVIDSADASEFMNDWLEGLKSTDFNLDGVVDEADLDAFMAAFFDEA